MTFKGKMRLKGGVFQTVIIEGVNSKGGAFINNYEPWFVIPPNSDILIDAEADNVDTAASASFAGIHAKIKG